MNFEDLKTPELQEKLKSAKTPEELAALAKEEGVELSDAALEALSGGFTWDCHRHKGSLLCEDDYCDDDSCVAYEIYVD